ncbi:efflux RND transporter periplasmic adaptor subunit [Motiliproteus sp. MSK22-1]|uniref:efflux RND transporter periplasmic adaptor subunit n=1 Tax=Motiliproteus sp. MSK22-1 TaxID=1897630 RepID=UPI000977BDDB|nr:efflux RND transporter periplasmic adaptor subunit [Motiliproteus sp. MSK22-1]OMH25650.1 hypothetical protein BGP75_24205 [Motiliproteus sp. MSK22-1]
MKRSSLLALAIFSVAALWMLTGSFRTSLSAGEGESQATKAEENKVRVQVETLTATEIARQLTLQGQVDPYRTAALRAETSGRVVKLPTQRGERVKAGQLLVQLSVDDRNARLAQAKALLLQRKSDLAASLSLQSKGLKAKTHIIQEKALVAAAEAELEQIRVELKNTQILAPFDGVLDQRPLELGDFVDRADQVATVVDDSKVLLTAQIPQRSLSKLVLGQQVNGRLITGREVTGTLTYISTTAETETRSYRIEVETPKPLNERWIGLSVSLVVPVERVRGHHISASLLNLNSSGELVVKILNTDQKVSILPVKIIRSEDDGVWVSGLPEEVTIITLGQGFYQQGETVQITDSIDPIQSANNTSNHQQG